MLVDLCHTEFHVAVSSTFMSFSKHTMQTDEIEELRFNHACWLVSHRVRCSCQQCFNTDGKCMLKRLES